MFYPAMVYLLVLTIACVCLRSRSASHLCQTDSLDFKERVWCRKWDRKSNQLHASFPPSTSTSHPCDCKEAGQSSLRDSTPTTSVLCPLQFGRCCWGQLTLILSVTMFSNYHSRHANMIAWLGVLFPWQLFWFWLCQSFHSLLHVASSRGSSSRSLSDFSSCVWRLFEVHSLFLQWKNFLKIHDPFASSAITFELGSSF